MSFWKFDLAEKHRKCSSALFLLTRVLASGTRLYIGAILLVVLCRLFLGRELTVIEEILLYCSAIMLVTLLTAIYTIWGGIKAVIWTDLFQTGLMIFGALFCLLLLFYRIPTEYRPDLLTLKWFNSGLKPGESVMASLHFIWSSPYTIWAALIANTFLTMATHGTDQDLVQRMLTAKTPKESRRSIILSGVADIPIMFGFLSIGLLLKQYYHAFPDASIPTKLNELFPYFILTQLPVGAKGLLISGLLATAMGSLSSALNALATTFTRDWGHLFPTKTNELRLARYATFFFALILAMVACLTATLVVYQPLFRIIPIAIGIFGYTYGSLLGVFMLGLFTKNRGSDVTNIGAMFVGFLAVLLIGGVPGFLQGFILPDLAFPWRVFIGTMMTLFIGLCFTTDKN